MCENSCMFIKGGLFCVYILTRLITRIEPRHEKTCFGVCDQVRLNRPAQLQRLVKSLEISAVTSRSVKLSRQRTKKALIRRRGCAGWFAPFLFAYGINMFSHDVAQIFKHFKLTILGCKRSWNVLWGPNAKWKQSEVITLNARYNANVRK